MKVLESRVMRRTLSRPLTTAVLADNATGVALRIQAGRSEGRRKGRGFLKQHMCGVLLEARSFIAQCGERSHQIMTWVDSKWFGQWSAGQRRPQFFQLAIRSRSEATRQTALSVDVPRGVRSETASPSVVFTKLRKSYAASYRLVDHLGRWRWRSCEVRGTLCYGFERLSLIARRRRHPKNYRPGQREEELLPRGREILRDEESFIRAASSPAIYRLRLVFLQRSDIFLQLRAAPSLFEASEPQERIAPLEIVVASLLDHGAKGIPDFAISFGIFLGQLFQIPHHATGKVRLMALEPGSAGSSPRDVER